jgi:magnesium-dependent phosphatase 1
MSKPKLIAFDLDGTIWKPDMYELWGGGAPFAKIDSRHLVDKKGVKVQLLGFIDQLLHDLHTNKTWEHTKLAWVSCTDEPHWADECLYKFSTIDGTPFHQIPHSSQIFKANKQVHFKKLHTLYKNDDIDYSDMLFFDNEYYNIETVAKLGVKCKLIKVNKNKFIFFVFYV